MPAKNVEVLVWPAALMRRGMLFTLVLALLLALSAAHAGPINGNGGGGGNGNGVGPGYPPVNPPAAVMAVDLVNNNSGTVNGAIFEFTDAQPTGTGVIDPFVRLQHNGYEQGYNTSGRPLPFDEKNPLNWTHDIQMSDIPVVIKDGLDYLQFLLDINEPGNQHKLLSLDEIQIYTSILGSQTTTNVGSLGILRYDLDAGGGDNYILLDYKRNHGSGSGDMFAYIPLSNFAGAKPTDFLYLYSKFGENSQATSQAGFEEWTVLRNQPQLPPQPPIPEPASILLLGSGLAGLARYLRRRGVGAR